MGSLQGEIPCFKVHLDRNGPLSANRDLSTAEHRHSHAFFTLQVNHPNLSFKETVGSDIQCSKQREYIFGNFDFSC